MNPDKKMLLAFGLILAMVIVCSILAEVFKPGNYGERAGSDFGNSYFGMCRVCNAARECASRGITGGRIPYTRSRKCVLFPAHPVRGKIVQTFELESPALADVTGLQTFVVDTVVRRDPGNGMASIVNCRKQNGLLIPQCEIIVSGAQLLMIGKATSDFALEMHRRQMAYMTELIGVRHGIWCPQQGLSLRASAYNAAALHLSYAGGFHSHTKLLWVSSQSIGDALRLREGEL